MNGAVTGSSSITGTSLATSSNGNIIANGSGTISTTSGNITTTSGTVSTANLTATGNVTLPFTQYTTSSGTLTLSSGSYYTVECTVACTVTLPAANASNMTGRVYNIKNTGSTTAVTVNTAGGNIDGASTYTIGSQYQVLTVQSNGTNWIIL